MFLGVKSGRSELLRASMPRDASSSPKLAFAAREVSFLRIVSTSH
jgi:hypothetical protein